MEQLKAGPPGAVITSDGHLPNADDDMTVSDNQPTEAGDTQSLMKRRNRVLLALGLVVAAGFYRSITMWTTNAWDLSSPGKILLIGAALAGGGAVVLLILVKAGLEPITAGLTVGGLLMVVMHWQSFEGASGPALVGLILLLAWVGHRARASVVLDWMAIAFVAAFGFAPILQLVIAHIQDSTPYPLVALAPPMPSTSSDIVEDVVVVIVDTYPSLRIRETWFGHDPTLLIQDLEGKGFTVQPNAWSRHTYTALSVSSILELRSVIDAGSTGPWGNRSSVFNLMRGDNLVSRTLQSAGFRYTHIESGWDGTSCGPTVDRCIESPWIDEQVWQWMAPTIALDWMNDRFWTVPATLNVAEVLRQELPSMMSNDSHDFVFAHFILPHNPILVDKTCELREDPISETMDLASKRAAFSDQMSCVDLLLSEGLEAVNWDAAVLLTGDHGTSTGQQVGRNPGEWSDADIAERFSVFHAYKLPALCDPPSLPDPIVAMNAILSCAVGQTFTIPPAEYLIGAQDPEMVEPERMALIQQGVQDGILRPDEE